MSTTTEKDPTKIAETIALLLAKAERTEFPREAEALTEQAERLMIRHGIEQALIDAARGVEQPKEEIVVRTIKLEGTYSRALLDLGAIVCAALGNLRTYRRYRPGTSIQHLKIVGFEGDADRAVTLVTSLHLQALTAMRVWNRAQRDSWDWEFMTDHEKTKARQAFVTAFGWGAANRIGSTRRAVVEESSAGTDLVLLDRGKRVENWMDENVGKLKRARSRQVSDYGRADGYRAGQRARTGEAEIDQHRALTG